MMVELIGMILLFFRHFVPSVKVLSLNLTVTQAGSSYGICLGPSLCSKLIFFKITIDQLTSLYFLRLLINNMTLHHTLNAVSFGKFSFF